MDKYVKAKKIAIVHDYLLRMGGAERVLKVFHEMFPMAPIYAILYDENFTDSFLKGAGIKASFLQKLPLFLRKRYKYFSLFIPAAVESLDLSEYDIVISSCSAFCKGVITRPDSIHICYCHTPTRFLWDWTHPYSALLSGKRVFSAFAKIALHLLRLWDQQSAKRVDYFIANSEHIAKRIKKYYKRDAKVIYPPVSLMEEKGFTPAVDKTFAFLSRQNGYYLIVSQLRPYKQIDVAIEAFKKLGYPLFVAGQGTDERNLKEISDGHRDIRFAGYVSDEILKHHYANCKALIFPGEEDFGLTMVEAMSFGKPVLALRRGGAVEIVEEGVSGEFFDDSHPVVLADGVRRLNESLKNYDPAKIMERAKRFSRERFEKEFGNFLSSIL